MNNEPTLALIVLVLLSATALFGLLRAAVALALMVARKCYPDAMDTKQNSKK